MTTDEKIDQALNDFQFKENQDKENDMLNEQILCRTAYISLKFQIDLANKGDKSNPNASKFKSSVNVLQQFYTMSKEVLNE